MQKHALRQVCFALTACGLLQIIPVDSIVAGTIAKVSLSARSEVSLWRRLQTDGDGKFSRNFFCLGRIRQRKVARELPITKWKVSGGAIFSRRSRIFFTTGAEILLRR